MQPLGRILLQNTQQVSCGQNATFQGGLLIGLCLVQLFAQRVNLGNGNWRIQVIVERLIERLFRAGSTKQNKPRHATLTHLELVKVAKAVVNGLVATLLIEARREIPGRIDASTGDIAFGDLGNPKVNDVLDDLGALALKMGGQVVVAPSEQMPTQSETAAIYRY